MTCLTSFKVSWTHHQTLCDVFCENHKVSDDEFRRTRNESHSFVLFVIGDVINKTKKYVDSQVKTLSFLLKTIVITMLSRYLILNYSIPYWGSHEKVIYCLFSVLFTQEHCTGDLSTDKLDLNIYDSLKTQKQILSKTKIGLDE